MQKIGDKPVYSLARSGARPGVLPWVWLATRGVARGGRNEHQMCAALAKETR